MSTLPPHIERILNLARWAPSGDNTQPWRFRVIAGDHVRVLGHDTREHCVYDLDGHASQMAHGALLETLAIAASVEGLHADIRRLPEQPEEHPVYDVRLNARPGLRPDPLVEYIETRCVQRRAMSMRPLEAGHRRDLEASVPGYRLVWFTGLAERWRVARFMAANAKNRLTMPEAWPTHSSIIEWHARFSQDRIPDRAVGVDPLTAHLMRWALGSWRRVDFLNTWLAGTLMPRIQLDLVPGVRCAAHLVLLASRPPVDVDGHVAAGRALQRLWLTASRHGLYMQPEMTPVIFSRYVRAGQTFTRVEAVNARARRLAARLEGWLGVEGAQRVVFMGRLGYGPAPGSRSLRRPLDQLLLGP
ncbi:MAG TPA: nitroreductase family protein [Thiobacillaceae bacterium]|nr:nitroreductase family protein [Thiobacillaceae bacterium]HNU63820.1 nitroreductase family protein [Thiobacillaceae bacterium]